MRKATPSPRSLLAWSALLLLTAWVSATAIRVEVLNHRMGGYLPRPQPPSLEGNDIPWRVSTRRVMEPGYRRHLLLERGGVAALDGLDDKAVMAIELTPAESNELERYLERVDDNRRLRALVSGPGMLQYLLVPLTIGLAILLWPKRSMMGRSVLATCIALCLASGALALYRQYFQAVID